MLIGRRMVGSFGTVFQPYVSVYITHITNVSKQGSLGPSWDKSAMMSPACLFSLPGLSWVRKGCSIMTERMWTQSDQKIVVGPGELERFKKWISHRAVTGSLVLSWSTEITVSEAYSWIVLQIRKPPPDGRNSWWAWACSPPDQVESKDLRC